MRNAGAASFRRRPPWTRPSSRPRPGPGLRAEVEEDLQPAIAGNKRPGNAPPESVPSGSRRRWIDCRNWRPRRSRRSREGPVFDHRPQATVMKMPDGGFCPAYNVQFSTTADSQIIVEIDVVTRGSEAGQIAPRMEQIESRNEEHRGRRRRGAFAEDDQIEAQPEEVICTVNRRSPPKDPKVDRYAPKPRDSQAEVALASPHDQRRGQGHLQGSCRDGRVRQCTGAESGPVRTARAWPTQGQGDSAVSSPPDLACRSAPRR